jgi:tetratricopeptide (TPR) repeat protein
MHVADLERVLTGTRASYSRTYETDGTTYVLTDGMSEALVAMTMYSAATDKSRAKGKVVAINNPYPMISFYLGTYYNEIGRPEDALRVLDAGLGLPPVMTGLRLGDSIPLLIRERGAALFSLKRWQEALENFDDGLTIESLEDPHRAGLLRGRGFALIELGRLDEAETMYQESLKLEPNNAIAKQELEYIAKLRAGGKKQPSELILQGQPKN